MKTRYAEIRWLNFGETFICLFSSFFVLALLLGSSTILYAEDRHTDGSALAAMIRNAANPLMPFAAGTAELDEKKTIKRNGQPIAPTRVSDTVLLVGPSSQAIHDVLYPEIGAREVGTPVN